MPEHTDIPVDARLAEQVMFDRMLKIQHNTLEEEAYAAATTALAMLPQVALFCPKHLCTHSFTLREVEELVYVMAGWWSDEYTPDGHQAEDYSSSGDFLAHWCPEEMARDGSDSEMYLDHRDAYVESRRHFMEVRTDG